MTRKGWLAVLYLAVLGLLLALGFAMRQGLRAATGDPVEGWTIVMTAVVAAAAAGLAVHADVRRKRFSDAELDAMRRAHQAELEDWKRQARPPLV